MLPEVLVHHGILRTEEEGRVPGGTYPMFLERNAETNPAVEVPEVRFPVGLQDGFQCMFTQSDDHPGLVGPDGLDQVGTAEIKFPALLRQPGFSMEIGNLRMADHGVGDQAVGHVHVSLS